MNLSEIIAKHSTTAATTEAVERTSRIAAEQIQFLEELFEEGNRISYHELYELVSRRRSTACAQAGSQLVKELPAALQPAVCRVNGGYGPQARRNWAAQGEVLTDEEYIGLKSMKMVGNVLSIFMDWKKAKAIEAHAATSGLPGLSRSDFTETA